MTTPPVKIAPTKESSSDEVELPQVEPGPTGISSEDEAALDKDEVEFRRLRRDLPGVKGAAAQGIVAISAIEQVIACTAQEGIVAIPAVGDIGGVRPHENVREVGQEKLFDVPIRIPRRFA